MPLAPPVTDMEQLKDHPAIVRLSASKSITIEGAKFDRDEMTIYIERG